MTDKRKLIEKIKALLSKTTESGCTEAEAMTAAEMASKLMSQYDLSLTDVEIGATECKQHTVKAPAKNHPLQSCLMAVAYLCDCKVWLSEATTRIEPTVDLFGTRQGGGVKTEAAYTFFGLEHDVEIAEYFTHICKAAMDREAAGFRETFGSKANGWTQQFEFGHKPTNARAFDGEREFQKQLPSFLHGMAASMAKTLRKMKDESRNAQIGNGRDLVVVKSDIVEREFNKLGMRLGKARSSYISDGGAFSAGQTAGRGVSFNAGVSGSGRTRQIAGR